MYEFTMGGAWFQWSALDRMSKWLAAGSLAAATVAAVPLVLYFGEVGHATGVRLGAAMSGRTGALPAVDHVFLVAAQPWMALVTIVGGIVSALLWWRFSLRQDEMFDRVQNWTLGMAGAWTMAATYLWLGLWAADVAPVPNAIVIALGFYVAMCGFWFAAVKRWA